MLNNVKSTVDDPALVAKRRGQLVQAAIKLFSRVGYHDASVKDIAEEAGVSPGLIYQYVPDKQDLLFLALLHICQRNKEEIPAALEGILDPIGRLHASVDAYARVIAANQQAVLLTYRETKSLKPEYIETMKRMELETNTLIANCIDECIRGRYLTPVNVELLVYRIVMGTHTWALKYWRLAKIVSLEEYLDQSVHSCWTSLLTAKGKRRYTEFRSQHSAHGVSGQRSKQSTDAGVKRGKSTQRKPKAHRESISLAAE